MVADIGCGTGGLEIGLLEHGIPFGKLYAVDTMNYSLDFLQWMLDTTTYPRRDRVVPVRSSTVDPMLPEDGLDLVLIVNVMNFVISADDAADVIRDPIRYLERLHAAIRPGGRIVNVLEFGDASNNEEFVRKAFNADTEGTRFDYGRLTWPLTEAGFRVIGSEELNVNGKRLLKVDAVK